MATRRIERYLIEAVSLALFMLFLAGTAVVLEHPNSILRQYIISPLARRTLVALLAGGWLAALAYSPWGKRSGAHINPAVTLAFARVGRIRRRDALGYIVAQMTGASSGMLLAHWLFGRYLSHPRVGGIVTQSGTFGTAMAFVSEAVSSFALMAVILATLSKRRWARLTGAAVGVSIALFIVVGGPLSGTSLNPARSLGAALAAGNVEDLWIYLVAPPIGMLAAAELFWRHRQQA